MYNVTYLFGRSPIPTSVAGNFAEVPTWRAQVYFKAEGLPAVLYVFQASIEGLHKLLVVCI